MKLFVSYAHVDIPQVQQLIDILIAGGHEPWFDHKLLPGQHWEDEILKGIKECDTFIYALTPEAVASEWCQWEFAKAIELEKPIVPILLQKKTKLPKAISKYQYADFTEVSNPNAIAQIMGGLTQIAITIPRGQAPHAPVHAKGLPEKASRKTSIPDISLQTPTAITRLSERLQFTDDELELNKAGQVSNRQRNIILKGLIVPGLGILIISVPVLVITTIAFATDDSGEVGLEVLLINIMPLILLSLLAFALWATWTRPHVHTIQGTLTFISHKEFTIENYHFKAPKGEIRELEKKHLDLQKFPIVLQGIYQAYYYEKNTNTYILMSLEQIEE